jgi:uncharacterized membrane protein YgdD (TMEM256/DUF423 family)
MTRAMRWTMRWIWSAAIVVSVTAAVGAHADKDMSKSAMSASMSSTFTGCVEVVNHGGIFLLTHLDADESKAASDHMTPGTVLLAGSSKLKKHVGQKVTVMGSLSKGTMGRLRSDVDTLTLGSLKVVAKSCS